MEEVGGAANSPSKNPLKRIDKRNNIILGLVGIPMLVMSFYGTLTDSTLLPIMWGELIVIIALGILYNWSVRKNRVDLRLGVVYSAVGIGLTFVLLSIGFLGMLLLVVYFPILQEGDFTMISFIPFFLCAYLVNRIVDSKSIEVAEKQWIRISNELSYFNKPPLEPAALYLAKKKWTGFWYYLFLYFLIELVPILWRYPDVMTWIFTAIVVIPFIAYSVGAYRVQRKSTSGFIS